MGKVKIKNVSNCVYSVAGVALLPDAVYEFDDDVATKWGLDSALKIGDLKVVSGKLLKPETKDEGVVYTEAIPIIAAEPEDEVEYDPYETQPEEEDASEPENEAVEEVVEEPVKPKRTRKTVSKAEEE